MAFWNMMGLTIALAALALVAVFGRCQNTGISERVYTSTQQLPEKRTSTDFVPDGDLSKASWNPADFVEFDHDASGKLRYPEISNRVASMWTETYVYFAFRSRYEALNVYEGEDSKVERWGLWDRDVVEVFLNPEPKWVQHYYEFEVAPNNEWVDLEINKKKEPFNDASWNSGFEHSTRIDAQNHVWATEIRIPIASMKVNSIHAGDQWRVNFFRAAGTGSDDYRKFLAWSSISEGKTFHVPTRCGILRLVN